MTDERAKVSGLRRFAEPVSAPAGHPAATAVPRPALRWKTRVLLPGIILLLAALLLLFSAGDLLRSAVDVSVLPVIAKTSGDAFTGGGVVAQAPGWVEPYPYAVSVPALADGTVEEMLVLEGEAVEAGQTLARLIDSDARLALTRAQAAVALREAETAAAEVAAGQGGDDSARILSVPGELAGSPDASALAEARFELARLPAMIAAQRARLQELRVELAAKAQAAERGVISSVPVDMLSARLQAQSGDLASLEAQEAVLRARTRRIEVEAAAELARSRAMLAAAQAARDEARLRLERMTVRSPAAGVVLARYAEPGSLVAAGTSPLVRLYDPGKLQVRVDVPLASAAAVGPGMHAEIVVDVLPDAVFRGEVVRVVHAADIQRNTLQFKVAIVDPSPLLKPEMLARVRFLAPPQAASHTGGSRLFAPLSAVGGAPGGTRSVWMADLSRNVARQRTVTLGAVRMQDWIEVAAGLQPGDRLIVSPTSGLSDGRKIRPVQGANAHGAD